MAHKKGDRIFHVDGSGNVHPAVATEDEKSGAVPIRYPNGKSAEIGTFHIFATENAANRAALDRSARKGPTKSATVTYIGKPK